MFDSTIEDFGCIQHEKYLFLGASPDGINIDKNSKRIQTNAQNNKNRRWR